MAGPSCGANCNSCAAVTCSSAPFCACNTNRIGDTSPISISFVSDSTDVTKRIAIFNQTNTPIITGNYYTGAGTTNTISTNWANICTAAGASGNTCEGSALNSSVRVGLTDGSQMFDSAVITVGVLAPTTDTIDDCTGSAGAICNFRAIPGDQSVYINDISGDAGYPAQNVTGVRFYVSDSSFTNASPTNSIKTADFSINADGSLSNNIIDGLNNDPATPYHFRVAAVDAANNVFAFVSDVNITNLGLCTVPADTNSVDDCRYHATPDQVLGLLTKDLNCFIATASYGSSLEPKLNTFRQFRNLFLLPHPFGKKLVMSYYHWGPYAARWIADREWARTVSRAALWPVWAFSYLSLRMGIEQAIALYMMGLVFVIALGAASASWIKTTWLKASRESESL
jgi:hypothetical protein